MTWPKSIEQWRRFVLWECKDIPPDLVLAIIQNESGGVVGAPGRNKTQCGQVPTITGEPREICRAYGLMQTIPATVQTYNQAQSDPARRATLEDLGGRDERAARLQIAIGCFYLAFVNHFLHKNFPEAAPAPTLAEAKPDQVRFALAGYAVGHNEIGEKLETLAKAGRPLTFANLKKYFPNWGRNQAGRWINRPLFYAQRVGDRYQANKTASYTGGPAGHLAARVKDKIGGGGVVVALALAAFGGWKYYQNRKAENENT